MNSRYQYAFNRLRKLENTLENICREAEELSQANRRLRAEVASLEMLAAARERVLKGLRDGTPEE